KRLHEQFVALELVQRGVQRRRQARDPALAPLPLRQGGRVNVDRLTGVEPAAHTVQTCVDQAAEREVRVSGAVTRLELKVGRSLGMAPHLRRNSQRSLAVVVAVADESAGPMLRLEAAIAIDAAAGQGHESWQVREYSADEV